MFNEKTGDLAGLKVIPADMDVMMITDGGIIIRVQADEISKIGRATQGVRIMKLKGEETKVVGIALTPHEDEEPEGETAEGEAGAAEGAAPEDAEAATSLGSEAADGTTAPAEAAPEEEQ